MPVAWPCLVLSGSRMCGIDGLARSRSREGPEDLPGRLSFSEVCALAGFRAGHLVRGTFESPTCGAGELPLQFRLPWIVLVTYSLPSGSTSTFSFRFTEPFAAVDATVLDRVPGDTERPTERPRATVNVDSPVDRDEVELHICSVRRMDASRERPVITRYFFAAEDEGRTGLDEEAVADRHRTRTKAGRVRRNDDLLVRARRKQSRPRSLNVAAALPCAGRAGAATAITAWRGPRGQANATPGIA